jgi:AbrB family looped-hinge helix DNA binding protein
MMEARMLNATLSSTGQITVPKPVQEALGLRPGDPVEFRICEDGSVVVQAATVELMALRGVLKPKIKGVSVEDMSACGQAHRARHRRRRALVYL